MKNNTAILKIAIVKISSLGDIVHTMPVVADILSIYPNAAIDWVVEEAFVDFTKMVRGVRKVLPIAIRRWKKKPFSLSNWREWKECRRQLRSEKYDFIIDCQGLLKTAYLSSCLNGKVIGLANKTEGSGFEWPVRFFYHQRVPISKRTHVVERSRQLVAAALNRFAPQSNEKLNFGFDLDMAEKSIDETHLNLPKQYAVFIHATSRADKQWPKHYWIELGKAFSQKGFSILLPAGNQQERFTSEAIAKEIGEKAMALPQLNLPAITGLLNKAKVMIGVDTGLMHIAAALQKPTVSLYFFPTVWRTGAYWSSNSIDLESNDKKMLTVTEVKKALVQLGIDMDAAPLSTWERGRG